MIEDIYALCDRGLLDRFRLSLEEFVRIAKRFNVKVMQYRDKEGSLEQKKENLKRLRALWDGLLIVNDELGLARLCDGVHIGQEDLEAILQAFGARSRSEGITILRKLSGAKIVGLSTHNLQEIKEANALELDYIGLGAYRASSTKEVENILGPKISELAKRSVHRVVAIGGICLFDEIEGVWKRAIGTDLVIKAMTYA